MAEKFINLKGEDLQTWRSKQYQEYLATGLNRRQSAELVYFVESPHMIFPPENIDRIQALSKIALEGGLLDSLK